jgi:hypothetical protein
MRVLFTQADLSIVEFPPGNPSSGFPPPLLDRDQFGVTQHSRIGIAGPDGQGEPTTRNGFIACYCARPAPRLSPRYTVPSEP